MAKKIREFVTWPPDPSGWAGSFAGSDTVIPDLAAARIERAQKTRLGVQLEVRIGDRAFHRSFPIAEQLRRAVAEALNKATGLGLDEAGDQLVE
jgi:hypothetical protein